MELLGRCFGFYSVALTGLGPSLTWIIFYLLLCVVISVTQTRLHLWVQRNGYLFGLRDVGILWHFTGPRHLILQMLNVLIQVVAR
ncbi:uncharacterized protein J3D65DRAFT_611465 [Phyllosticta citribraziliensis]|uniref:Uncharacterized protein n=1 Tax=Phyllosticta citribraziliensis TaxID=989973 RepID=A0ABR1MAT5_9PEZI